MNYYFLKIILKNKFTKLLALGIIFIVFVVSLQLNENIHDYDLDDYIFQYKSKVIDNRASLLQNKYYMTKNANNPMFNSTDEGDRAYIEFEMWRLKETKRLLQMLQDSEKVTEEFIKEERRFEIIEELCDIQSCISVPNGDIPLEEACAEELKQHEDFLRLDELTFNFSDLAYCGQGTYDVQLSDAHDNMVLEAKLILDKINNPAVTYYNPSPYIFLSVLFGDFELTKILLPLLVLLFSTAIVMKWKEEKSYTVKIPLNYSSGKMLRKYIINVYVTSVFLTVLIIGILFVIWGVKGDFDGFNAQVMCDADNFSTFSTFNHDDSYYRIGITKVFYDFVDIYCECTIHNYMVISLGKFLLASGLLGLLKLGFYVIIGAGIGFVFIDKLKSILLSGVVCIVIIACNTVVSIKKWNPFSVGSCWNITLGGYGMTWLNAVLLLTVSIIVLYIFFSFVIKIKDTE